MTESSSLISVADVSLWLAVKPKTIYSWVESGYIPHLKIGRVVRFCPMTIREWLKGLKNSARSGSFLPIREATSDRKR